MSAPIPGDMIVVVVSETRRPIAGTGGATGPTGRKRSPNYSDMMPKPVSASRESATIGSHSVEIETKVYPSGVVAVSVRERVPDAFSLALHARRQELARIALDFLRAAGCEMEDPEEYAIYCVAEFAGDPEPIIAERRAEIVQLLKSEDEPLDETEVSATLERALRYGKADRAIVDWDAAFLFDASRDFTGDVEVLEIANRTLLRYRLLDRRLDVHLEEALSAVRNPPRSFFGRLAEVRKRLQAIAEIRLLAIRELNQIDGDIKLYGNWYLARLYDLASRIFHIEDRRRIVSDNVDQLEQLYQMAAENFASRRTERLEMFQLVGWTVLLIGYFLLFALEASRAT